MKNVVNVVIKGKLGQFVCRHKWSKAYPRGLALFASYHQICVKCGKKRDVYPVEE
jgi:hypothetical protein